MKILNLGAGGFIGSHLTEYLLAAGHVVVGVDTHTDKVEDLFGVQNLTWLRQDIRQPDFDLNQLVADADLVIDLIAHANPGIYIKQPLDVFRLNFGENLKIAEACVEHGKRLIQFSSCEVYGKTVASVFPAELLDTENPKLATFVEDETNFILGPVRAHRWIYACAKQLLERVLHAYGISGTLNYTIIRPFNFIGPKIDYLPGETDGFPRVFSHFMEALILGTEMKLVDGGSQRRCYTDIADAIECIGKIVGNSDGACDRHVFNIGSPQNEVTIRELAERMRRIFADGFGTRGATLPKIVTVSAEEFYGDGYEDSDRRIPDITKARTILGWEPKIPLDETLIRTMRYYAAERA